MQTVTVTRTIPAPIGAVFDAYTDHERLADLPVVLSAKVVVPGRTEKNGLGAVRVVNGGLLRFREEITGFERPTLMEYKIVDTSPVKCDHELGRVEFTEVPGGTTIVWTTRFGARLLGGRADKALALMFRAIFTMTLRQVEQRAVAAAQKTAA